MARFRFSNNASALVTTAVSSTATTVQLETGAGGLMPVLGTGDRFPGTLVSADGSSREIVYATGVVADTVTVQRGQEGTPATTFAIGSRFEVRMTAGMAENFVQRSGDSMNGPLDMNGNQIKNADFSATTVRFNFYHAALWRATDIPSDQAYDYTNENSIYLPPNGNPTRDLRRPSYYGRSVPNTEMFDGVVHDWFGDVNHLPSWFKLCNGTGGTPDLRGRYVKGWTETFGVGGFGGAETARAQADQPFGTAWGLIAEGVGDHQHGGTTADAALSGGNLPAVNMGTPGRTTVQPVASGGVSVLTNLTAASYGAAANHAHGFTTAAAGGHSHFVYQPPFYVLAKVVFTF